MDTQKNMNLQNNISFLRIRPCDSDNEIYLNSRKKEGTSSFYIDKTVDLEKIHKKIVVLSKEVDITTLIIDMIEQERVLTIDEKRGKILLLDDRKKCDD